MPKVRPTSDWGSKLGRKSDPTAPDMPVSATAEVAEKIDSALLAAIVASSDDAIVSKTLDGKIVSWNGGAERIFGHTAEEAIGKQITLIIPPDLQAEERQILEKLKRGERIDHFETTRITKSGRLIPMSLTVSPVRNSRGQIVGASKVARDISMQRENERLLSSEADALAKLNNWSSRLWRARNLHDGLNETLTAVLELIGADMGVIQTLDPHSYKLAIAVQRGFQQDYLEFFREVSSADESACGRALRSGRRIVIEDVEADAPYAPMRTIARAAGYRAVISTPLIGSEGKLLGIISTHFRAAHRPADQDFRRLDLYLRLAINFIQRCNMEQALRQSAQALRDADRRKDEFLALLAHELRNPLAPIRYALATGKKSGLGAEQRKRAEEIIERQVSHMSHLLDDLLDVSRITRGTLALKKRSIDLASVIETGVEAARPILDAKAHVLALIMPDEPVRLHADPVRLAQVFSNLLINAGKYTDPNGHIQLNAKQEGDVVVVAIRDDGIGISQEMMPRLFTLFSQARPALERSEGGLGVGLSLVRGLVTLHGGQIEARSAGIHQGSEFIVRLPVGTSPEERPAIEAAERTATAAGLKVMVVDDNRDAAESCAMLLELSGHKVQTAYSGREAMDVAEAFRPHVLLLDIGLPDVTGYLLAERIRAAPWGHGVALIAVTGWGQEEDRRRAFEAGFDHHLTKPIEPEHMERLLRSLAEATRKG